MGKRMHVGRALIEGPEQLYPPSRIDNFGYLEPVLKIYDFPMAVTKHAYSWLIYTDDTINRHENFLVPVVRFADWNRPYEQAVRRVRKWPVVNISQHILSENEQIKVDKLLRELDRSLSKIDFVEAGLITNRETPPECYPNKDKSSCNWVRHLSVVRSNACQSIELGLGLFGSDNKHIETAVRAIAEYIEELCLLSPAKLPYRESYEENLKLFDGWHGYWFYRPHAPKTKGATKSKQ
jgi:hypothetical protein